ncbi:MAG: N-formylglutamate amidohydrolase [Alphaproteobacteria bacterium]|nr:N-formylglutamate amidohydrolase [Alphaproteobacteria bacterium]
MSTPPQPRVLVQHDPGGVPVPLVFDSPHSGTDYPADFGCVAPMPILRTGEDTHIDDLFGAAPAHGAVLIAALFPRSYIDVNRDELDIDPTLLAGAWPGELRPGEKTRLGMGLIRRLAQPGVPMYDRKLPVAEIQARIDTYYRPYHATLRAAIDRTHERFGGVWHLNCHSMGAVGSAMTADGPKRRPDFVLGDRDGTTCGTEFTATVFQWLKGRGYQVTINDPYKGVELVRRYSNPSAGRHSLQVEINRALYMDETTREPNAGYTKLKSETTALIGHLAGWVRGRTA